MVLRYLCLYLLRNAILSSNDDPATGPIHRYSTGLFFLAKALRVDVCKYKVENSRYSLVSKLMHPQMISHLPEKISLYGPCHVERRIE